MPSKHTNTSPALSESCHTHLVTIPSHCPILLIYGLKAKGKLASLTIPSHCPILLIYSLKAEGELASFPSYSQSFSPGEAWE